MNNRLEDLVNTWLLWCLPKSPRKRRRKRGRLSAATLTIVFDLIIFATKIHISKSLSFFNQESVVRSMTLLFCATL
jgi:hypothetical protein